MSEEKRPKKDFSWFEGKVDVKLIRDFLRLERKRRTCCPTCGRRFRRER